MSQFIEAVVPVLDLMIGQIVLAKAGNRDEYRPVETPLTFSSQPLEVAKAIFNQTSCDWLYLADIDSFAGANLNWKVYNDLLNHGFGLWIDAQWLVNDRLSQIADKIDKRDRLQIILSSEALSSLDQFAKFEELKAMGIDPIFSLDQKGGSTITQGEMTELSSLEMVQRAYEHGVRHMILLDLDSVGTMRGVDNIDEGVAPLIREIKSQLSDVRLISGGGIKSVEDVQALLEIGCQHVLVASAIHHRKLTPDDIGSFRSLMTTS